MARVRYATPEDDAEAVPPDQRCIWPGCARRRAPGRASGSGRQKEYCEKADRPENGGGPEHTARNRWALRERAQRDRDWPASGPGGSAGGEAGEDAGHGPGLAGDEAGNGGEEDRAVRPGMPLTRAKLHAADLLEQARRQHGQALEALAAERDLYARLGEQLQVLADPAALDLEIAAVTLKAGREVSQAAEDAARARQEQLTARRERDEAVRARRDADQALAARTAELEAEHDRLLREALDAGLRAGRAEELAARARTAADEALHASEAARRAAEQAMAEAARQVSEAAGRADAAAVRADEAIRAAEERASAERQRADEQADRAARQAAEAIAAARADAEAARGHAQAASAEAAAARAEAAAAAERAASEAARRQGQQDRIAQLEAAGTAFRQEADRLRAARDRDITRLEVAHREAIDAERARARRAEAELDALRAERRPGS